MDLNTYNSCFERLSIISDEEADNRIRVLRQQCVRTFIDRLKRRQHEWDIVFHDLLNKSQQDDSQHNPKTIEPLPQPDKFLSDSTFLKPSSLCLSPETSNSPPKEIIKENVAPQNEAIDLTQVNNPTSTVEVKNVNQTPALKQDPSTRKSDTEPFTDPEFSNVSCLKEFIRVQDILETNKKSLDEIVRDSRNKPLKNQLNLFIKTQINSISNSDPQHLETKIRQLTDLFIGRRVFYQDRFIDASQHPLGQLYAMDYAAQTFVSVGARVVNSVPAIAKSMATVINGISQSNNDLFKDLILGNLQECCPYLIPMQPNILDYGFGKDGEVKYKVACGYSCDMKTQTLETDEKYYLRMRSMVLLYACILVDGDIEMAWSWLASFLSLHPEPVMSALVLQAFLQEASKKMSSAYGKQYKKLIEFLRTDYIKMIEDKTKKEGDRQSLVKLKNLLSNNSNLIAAPSVSSIFGTVRMQ